MRSSGRHSTAANPRRRIWRSTCAARPAGALTAIESPQGIESGEIVKKFREEFGALIANGQGEMKGKLFCIAHLGYYDFMDTIGILAALEQVIASVTGKEIEFGSAVRAAQRVYSAHAGHAG